MFEDISQCESRNCRHWFDEKELKYQVFYRYKRIIDSEIVYISSERIICNHCYNKLKNREFEKNYSIRLKQLI